MKWVGDTTRFGITVPLIVDELHDLRACPVARC